MKIDKGLDGRGLYRSIYCAIWSDSDFRKFSIDEKLVFLNLRTSPLTNIASIYPYYAEAIEQQTGLPRDAILKALGSLSERGWIRIEDGVVWIVKGLKFDPNITVENPNHLTGIKRAILALPRCQLVREFIDYYHIPLPYPIPSRSHPDPIPKHKGIPYIDQEKD